MHSGHAELASQPCRSELCGSDCEGSANGAQQHILAERLGQKLDSARLHGFDAHGHIAMTRDKDDRHFGSFDGDALLQFKTVEARKRYVEYEATWNKDSCAVKEFFC